MASRRIEQADLVGKTIKTIDCTAVNWLVIYFTDGTMLELETENVGNGIFGIMVQEKTCA